MKNEPFITTAAIAFLLIGILTPVGFIWDIWGYTPDWFWKLDMTVCVVFLVALLGYYIFERD